jgi:ABC-type glycerol-3-phosphate transport system permease component
MKKRAATLICGALFVLFHSVVVLVPVVASGGHGERQGLTVALFDAPLVVLAEIFEDRTVHHHNLARYILLVAVGGTLLYACCGALVGYVIDRIRQWLREPPRTEGAADG